MTKKIKGINKNKILNAQLLSYNDVLCFYLKCVGKISQTAPLIIELLMPERIMKEQKNAMMK
jgi:hypothetical protein